MWEARTSEPLIVFSRLPDEQPYQSRYRVHDVVCRPGNDHDYWRGLHRVWDTAATLVIIEHDMERNDALIGALLGCKYGFCTWSYPLWWPSTHKPEPHYAQRTGLKPPAGGDWIRTGDEWCDFTGIGFCKIRPEVRVGPLSECHWSHLDSEVSRACVGRVHVHWRSGPYGLEPIEHDHY